MSRNKTSNINNLVLLTSSFPYEGGEQFLESEIQYWENTKFDNVYIMPYQAKGSIRLYPKKIKVIKPIYKKSKANYALLSLFSPIYRKELLFIKENSHFTYWPLNIKSALTTTALTLRVKDMLADALKHLVGDITVYSYWNDVSFYAACELKRKGIVKHVISRAHRFDIYEERRINTYMPLKRQFVRDIDKVYLLSNNALSYYSDTYGADSNNLDVGRLGVNIPSVQPDAKSTKVSIKILSLSYCVPVKQIDKIMSAVESYAKINSNLIVEWTHIGNGPLYESLKARVDKLDSQYNNIKINFIGQLDNKDVKNKLEKEHFDVFINASKSEGIPVSIMEAMSYGVPAIAPDVGEISDLVNDSNGYLLSNHFVTDDIIDGINMIISESKKQDYRKNAKSWVEKYFNSSVNYPLFIRQVESIAGLYDS